jgi:hypothetical protein
MRDGSIMNEVVESMLADRRREAVRHRRIAAARRARRSHRRVPAWRVHVGRALIRLGTGIGGSAARRAAPRNVGGVC